MQNIATISSVPAMRKVVLSCMIGNASEWYDFVVYGYFVGIIGKIFQPPDTASISCLIWAYSSFALGFISRPVGAILFGHIGDKFSRKTALLLSIYMMAIPTTLIGLLPTYSSIGYLAPSLLLILRLFQGLAMGGEFTGSMVFMVEHAKEAQRGFAGSFATCSCVIGVVVGSSVVMAFNYTLGSAAMEEWGWRIPFLLSAFASIIGSYMRRTLSDPEVYLEQKKMMKSHGMPLKDLFKHYWKQMLTVVWVDFLTAIGFFVIVMFLPTYMSNPLYIGLHSETTMSINTANMILFACMNIIGGSLSDIYGRRILLLYPALGFVVLSYPLFWLFGLGPLGCLFGQMGMVIMMGLFFGTIPSALVELFPSKVRFSGLSLSHNISMAMFGGIVPYVATHLIRMTENIYSPAILLIFGACMTIIGIRYMKPYNERVNAGG